MKIGVIGSGNIGATAARLLVQAGHEVAVSNSRGGEGLKVCCPGNRITKGGIIFEHCLIRSGSGISSWTTGSSWLR